MNIPTLPICPQCRQTDQVQKVTSTFATNTKEWKETVTGRDSWGNTSLREVTKHAHTVLGLKLKPPDEPRGPTHPGMWYGLGGLVVLVLSSFLCPLAFLPFTVGASLINEMPFLSDMIGLPPWAVSALGIGAPLLCCGVPGLVAVIWLGSIVKRRFESDTQRYREKKAAFDRDELPRWQTAKARWEQLYYCLRDETIFIPAENAAIKADDMERYLYDPQFRS